MALVCPRPVLILGLLFCGCPAGPVDLDQDGFAAGDDCDDERADINPDADEVCDGLDNDCDGAFDDEDSDWVEASVREWYEDADRDSFGGASLGESCAPPEGAVGDESDCDDTSNAVYPGAPEICDGLDNDCDELVDTDDVDVDLKTTRTWYLDVDDDGYGQPFTEIEQCDRPEGYADNNRDCNDGEPAAWDKAPEICDQVDNDCDGLIDDEDDLNRELSPVYYPDEDEDGYGNPSSPIWACSVPDGHVEVEEDCRDDNPRVHPDADEICDGLDNDCDFEVDEDDADFIPGELTWYRDLDGDDVGDPNVSYTGCAPPTNYVLTTGDCDDLAVDRHPGLPEICDGVDNDCDATTGDWDGWWDTDWPYRVRLTVNAALDVPSAGVAAEVDFGEVLADAGDFSGLALHTVRVVRQSCSGHSVVASQVEDGLTSLFERSSGLDVAGDERAMVAFHYDTDGDANTAETAVGPARFTVYFASVDTAGGIAVPSYPSPLSGSVSGMSNDLSEVTFDGDNGGLLANLGLVGGPVLASAADASSGNGIYTDQWLVASADTAPSVELLASGPVLSVVRTRGARSSSAGGMTYEILYWMFARRPEVYSKVSLVTDGDTDVVQNVDYTRGIRPLQIVSDYFEAAPGTSTVDGDQAWIDQTDSSAGVGLSMGFVEGPAHHEYAFSSGRHMFLAGNDIEAAGSGTSASFADGVALVDYSVVAIWPHDGTWANSETEMMGLMQPSSVTVVGADAY